MSNWLRMPSWKKRIHGFFTYQFAAYAALFFPIEVDLALRDALNEQFKELEK